MCIKSPWISKLNRPPKLWALKHNVSGAIGGRILTVGVRFSRLGIMCRICGGHEDILLCIYRMMPVALFALHV